MTKQEARTSYLSRRLAMPEPARQQWEKAILARYRQIAFPPLKCVHVYQPILSKKEIDTLPFVRHLETLFPGLTLVVPRVSGADSMEHIRWNVGTFFVTNAWGIPEPLAGAAINPSDIDMVIVPLVIFDQNGTRVGYGKGLYDRFLSFCRPDVIKIGLSLFEPISPIEDSNEFDVPLSIGITPTQLYEFV